MHERAGFAWTDIDPELNVLADDVLAAVRTVRNGLGAGMYEKVYERALAIELTKRGHLVQCQVPQEVLYDGVGVGIAFRADLIVDARLLVELRLSSLSTPDTRRRRSPPCASPGCPSVSSST